MRRWLAIALTAPFAAWVLLPAQAQTMAGGPGYEGYGWSSGWGWGHMLFGSLMMLLFFGAVIFLVVLAVRWLSGGFSHRAEPPAARKPALHILEERFARGEIDKAEFEERRRLLSE